MKGGNAHAVPSINKKMVKKIMARNESADLMREVRVINFLLTDEKIQLQRIKKKK